MVLGEFLAHDDPAHKAVYAGAAGIRQVSRNAALAHAYSSEKLEGGALPVSLSGGILGSDPDPAEIAKVVHGRFIGQGYAHAGQSALSSGPAARRSGERVYAGTVANYYEKGGKGVAVIHSDDDGEHRVHGYRYDALRSPIGSRGMALRKEST
jgi:hypothetical protein